MPQGLVGKVVIVTGAAGGIGSACVRQFAEAGARVVAVDLQEDLESLIDGLEQVGSYRHAYIPCNVVDDAQVRRLITSIIDRMGRIDVLVNCAGIEGPVAPLEDYSVDDFRKVMEVNVVAPFLLLRECLPHLKLNTGASVVNISSTAGLRGVGNLAAYVASKHALIGLTQAAAVEVSKDGVRVNAVCPGPVSTGMLERIDQGQTQLAGGTAPVRSVPMGRSAEPSEIANAVVFLSSSAASYMSGSVMVVDGARTCV